MKFYVRFAKLSRVFVVEKSSNKKIVRDKYIKWRNDVIVNSEDELVFSFKDLINAREGGWTEVKFENIVAGANTTKSYILELSDKSAKFEIKCHPDDLQSAIKEYSGEKKGFLISLQGSRFFVKKKGIETIPIYVVKEGKLKEQDKAITSGINPLSEPGDKDQYYPTEDRGDNV